MTDRELLEFAAKAAGIEVEWFTARIWNDAIDGYEDATDGSGVFVAGDVEWNPLDDDGDALRLMVKLGFVVDTRSVHFDGRRTYVGGSDGFLAYEAHGNDPDAATRRAIVLAAAAIGKEMP